MNTEQSMEAFWSAPRFIDVDQEVKRLKTRQYWLSRHFELREIMHESGIEASHDTTEATIKSIIDSEMRGPIKVKNRQHNAGREESLQSVLTSDMEGAVRFQRLCELEGIGKPSDYKAMHVDRIKLGMKTVVEHATDGLILLMNYTKKNNDQYPRRKLQSVKPLAFDVANDPWIFKFDEDHTTHNVDPSVERRRLMTTDSGLHLLKSVSVLEWEKDQDQDGESGFFYPFYRIHATDTDRYQFPFGGSGWSSSAYPDTGPAMFFGEDSITEFITRMCSFGGEQLKFIQNEVGDFPGFGFVHDIEPTGDIGSDADSIAPSEPLIS